MAGNDPPNLDPFGKSREFQRSEMGNKRRLEVHQHSAEIDQESKKPRFTEPGMLNSSPSSRKSQEPCPDFLRGRCNYGERCRYSHEQGPFYPSLGDGGATTKMCHFFMKGQICPFGEKCQFSHRRSSSNVARERFRKTKICKYWKYDICKNGPECSHAHGEAELRVLPPHQRVSGTVTLEQENAASSSTEKAATDSLAASTEKVVRNSSEQENAESTEMAATVSLAASTDKVATDSSEPRQVPRYLGKKLDTNYADWPDDPIRPHDRASPESQ